MNTKIEEVNLYYTIFQPDVNQKLLRQVAVPQNVILFDKMKDHGTHYTFDYDVETRNVADQLSRVWDVREVKVKTMAKLDPLGMSKCYGVPIDELWNYTDKVIMTDRDLLNNRLMGKRPELEILDKKYSVDIHNNKLIPEDAKLPRIDLDLIQLRGKNDGNVFGYFNLATRQPVEIDDLKFTALPRHIVVIGIPSAEYLDPVGLARAQRKDDLHYVSKNGLKKLSIATITPLTEEILKKQIEKNLIKNRNNQKLDPIKKQRKRPRI